MKNNISKKYAFKKDRYSKNRGGNSCFFDISCSACDNHIALYQKDGAGKLLRMYIDRIFAPATLAKLQFKNSKKDLPNLQCLCGTLIGVPMMYKLENRLAFRMVRGSFTKKNCNGTHPPPIQ